MMPLISIIIPVYKVEEYLDKCVKSVVSQSYQNLEIILVDDGSPDNCPRMCDEWSKQDCRIKVLHRENGGLSDARNAGLDVAKGEYLVFVDSDDFIHPSMIEKLYDTIVAYNTDIAICGIFRTDGVNHKALPFGYSHDVNNISSIQALKDIFTYRCTIAAWNKLYKRSCIGRTRFIKGRYNEDLPFLYELFRKKVRVSYITEPLYYYYKNPNGITGNFSAKLLDGLKNAIEVYKSSLSDNLGCEKECEEYLDRNVVGAIRMLYMNHAVKQFPVQFNYCRKYSMNNFCRLVLSKKYTYKMKMWLLLAIIHF